MARFRRKAKAEGERTESVDLSESEHAWWANGRVQSAPGLGVVDPTPEPDGSAFDQGDHEPWLYTDVFAPDIDEVIGTDTDPLDGPEAPPQDSRSLAEVFSEEAAHRCLGLEAGASWDDIVLAHRRMAKRYHPDRLVHADEETRLEGERLMVEANAAFETLRQQHRPHTHTTGLFSR